MLNETRNDTESDDGSDSKSIMMSERDMENLGETEKCYEGLISTELLQDRSYIPGSTYKEPYKRGWRSNNTVQIGNRHKTFSVTFMCFILSVCCTESYGAR